MKRLTYLSLILPLLLSACLVGCGPKEEPADAPNDQTTDSTDIDQQEETTPTETAPVEPGQTTEMDPALIAQVEERVVGVGGSIKKNERGDIIWVDLETNDLTTTEDDLKLFGQVKTLERLRVYGAEVKDEGIAHITDLPNLRVLAIENATDMTNKSIEALTSLQNLDELYLRRASSLTDDALANMKEFPRLTKLTLLFCNFTNEGMQHIAPLTSLHTLDIRGNDGITDEGLQQLAGLTRLASFRMRGKEITDEGFKIVEGMKGLKVLYFQDGSITDAGLEAIKGKTELVEFTMFTVSGITEEGLANLQDSTKMRKMQLRDVFVAGECFKNFQGMESLTELDLSETYIMDEHLAELKPLKNLKKLVLWNDPMLTDAGLATLAEMPSLEDINLKGTGITDAGLAELAKLPNLKKLTLDDVGGITDEGLKSLEGVKTLQQISIKNTMMVSEDGVMSLKAALPDCNVIQ